MAIAPFWFYIVSTLLSVSALLALSQRYGHDCELRYEGSIGCYLSLQVQVYLTQGRIQDLKKGGHNTLFFFRTAASLESRASPTKKLMSGGGGRGGGGGGTPTLFFGAPPASRVAQVPNGGGGGDPTHFCVPTHFF